MGILELRFALVGCMVSVIPRGCGCFPWNLLSTAGKIIRRQFGVQNPKLRQKFLSGVGNLVPFIGECSRWRIHRAPSLLVAQWWATRWSGSKAKPFDGYWLVTVVLLSSLPVGSYRYKVRTDLQPKDAAACGCMGSGGSLWAASPLPACLLDSDARRSCNGPLGQRSMTLFEYIPFV
jgi:hypothetical protein